VTLALWMALLAAQDPVQAARQAEAAGDLALAERHYEQALGSRQDPEILQRLGLVRYLQNKFTEAIPAFEKAVAANPKLWGSHLFLGVSYYRTNRFQEALQHLKTADRLQPRHNEVEFWLGATQLALKNYMSGLAVLERLLERDPKNAEVLRLLAQNYSEYGAALWSGVAERHFESAPGQEVHGHALEFEGAAEPAMAAFRQALAIDPSRRGVHLAIGRALLARGKWKEAQAELEQELKLQPGDPEAGYYLGMALLGSGEPGRALPYLEAAERWEKHAVDAAIAVAKTYTALGRRAEAAAAAERALKLDPESEEARRLAGR
jgi:tetratricopeptide (TPR) repeat protein